MRCQLRSADRTLYDGDASMVVAQSPRGEFAIMSGHAPLLAVLAQGPIRIQSEKGENVFVCRGGTLRVQGNETTLLVESALAVQEIDLEEVRRTLAALGEEPAVDSADASIERAYLLALQAAKERYG
jgi:F-type H+-transporting ATPase subunit epsilon